MLPESLPSEYGDIKTVWKILQKDGLLGVLSWFDTDTIATITETPTHCGGEKWKGIKLPYNGPHARGTENESILCLPDTNGPATVISIGLAVLDAITRNLPNVANEKYDLFKRIYALYQFTGGEGVWRFHFPEMRDGGEGYTLSANQDGVNPYDITD